MKLSSIQLLILRAAIAGLFLSLGLEKYHEGWLQNPEHLAASLNNFHQHAGGAQLVYLERIAIPYANIWSKVMTIGEFAVGVSMLLGLLVRLSAASAIFMVMNFHAATGNLFSLNFFGSPWAALLIVSLLAMFLSRAGRWVGVDTLLAKSNAKGILW
jgi:uncharacterized membrane protein YphA (DoxX/SURF4 family)